MFRTSFSSDSNVTVSAHCVCGNSNNKKNTGITKRNICYIFSESFDVCHRVSDNWPCPTTGPKTLDLH